MYFTKLRVWQAAIQLADDIYELTKRFPPEERYRLVDQLRRAAVSVHSNIAEGSRRDRPADKARMYNIAETSLAEIQSQLKHCKRQLLYPQECERIIRRSIGVGRLLYALKRSALNPRKEA